MIVLTADLIEQLRTPAGGFNQETMEIITLWPLQSGWKERLIGTTISDRNWKRALKAKCHKRHVYRGNTRKRQ